MLQHSQLDRCGNGNESSGCSLYQHGRVKEKRRYCCNASSSSSFSLMRIAATLLATTLSSRFSSTASSTSKPLVRGHESQSAGSDSHLLRNNPLRTNKTPSSSATLGQRTTSFYSGQQQREPTRNLLLDEQEEASRDVNASLQSQNDEFLQWCYETWGIDSSLVEIDMFEYYDYVLAMGDRIDIFCEDCYDGDGNNDEKEDGNGLGFYYYDDLQEEEDRLVSITEYPPVSVRGLKAARNIDVGEVILSIPHHALWTLSNIIDKDVVLSKIMGKEMREQHGWDSQIDEIPLLAVALLYHMKQLQDSPGKNAPHGPYVQILLQQDLDSSIPHLWSPHKLRRSAPPGVRKVAKGIQRDVLEMYETIVLVLVEEHPEVFGEPWEEVRNTKDDVNLTTERPGRDRQERQDRIVVDENGAEWMFSLERFHWAFALINSRHWHLPVLENVSEIPPPSAYEEKEVEDNSPTVLENDDNVSFNDQPPASMPTEEWMQHQRDMQIKEEEHESHGASDSLLPVGNSFLAPVADLLNFGPPCTRGVYNRTADAFEIIATCRFLQGQEITFWYTDACEDVFMANYGFTQPGLVPKCPNAKDQSDATIRHLSRDLSYAYGQLDLMDQQVDELLAVLHDCHCENQTDYLKVRKGGQGAHPPKAPSPPRDDEGDRGNNDRVYRVQNRNGVRDSRNDRHDGPSHHHDARHAIRGRSRRSAKERSPKANGRKSTGASRKSEF